MSGHDLISPATAPFDVESIRADFPALDQQVHGRPLVYLDNAATAQKPNAVINSISNYYRTINSNVHRGAHALADASTEAFETARDTVRAFLDAGTTSEIVFTKGTTESVNLVAHAFSTDLLSPGDEVVVSEMEHHSNFVPWQLACQRSGARLVVAPITDSGELDYEAFLGLINDRTRLVALVHVSNTLGTINDTRRIVDAAHERGAAVLLDGAQAVPHMPVDVKKLNCDFYCLSGHKVFAPMGVGVLYGKADWLNRLSPYQSGGSMIENVSAHRTTFNVLPYKFEAGTPNVAGAVGLAAALDYISGIGLETIEAYEAQLVTYALDRLSRTDGIRFVGEADHRASVVSFVVDGIHPYDIGTLLDQHGIATRTGHHCTEPLMARFGLPGTVRASFAFYNTMEEADRLADAVVKVVEFLR